MKIEIEIEEKDLRAAVDALTKIVLSAKKQNEVLPIKILLVQLIKQL